MLDLLLKNGVIITVDAQHRVYSRGFLGVKGDCIACIGQMDGTPLPEAARVIDLDGTAILPGLIDGHGHAGHCLTKVLAEHMGDDNWGRVIESIYYQFTDEEFWYVEGALAAAERLKFGVTSGVSMVGNTPRIDALWPVKSSLEGAVRAGIRSLTGIGSANGPWPKLARTYHGDGSYTQRQIEPEQAFAVTQEAVRTLNGVHPRQQCIVAPGNMGFRRGESVQANIRHNQQMLQIAREYDVPIHTHATGGDVAFLYEHTPEVLEWKLSLTHSTGYCERELEILADSNAYVFHAPTAHAHIKGWCPALDMLKRGIKVAVVTDGTAPDRSYDLWRDMKNVQLLQRAHFRDTKLLPCGKVLEMVTIEPAKALGIDRYVGSLEVGKKADIIRVNTWQPHLTPFVDMPVQRLVYFAMGQDVDLVIVNGEIMMEGRTLTQIDERKLQQRAVEVYRKTVERAGEALGESVFENPCLYGIRSV